MIDTSDNAVLRRLTGGATLAERLHPAVTDTLPHPVRDQHVLLRCTVEAKLREDAAMLARVAPFVLVSRPVVRQVPLS